MRYAESPKAKVETPVGPDRTNREFFERVWSQVEPKRRAFSLLFVGGNDALSVALRRAQAALRFDGRESLWSHIALLVTADDATPGLSRGLEVSLDPQSRALQVPERNGVTEFVLERYLDERRYPNLALTTLTLGKSARGQDGIASALRHPNRDRERFPLWRSLAAWARYVYAPEVVPNPLLEAVSMPSAGLCEYAFEAAGVDLTPGATANNVCPELIWSTVNHWQESLAGQVELTTYAVLRDPTCTRSPALPLTIDLPVSAPRIKDGKARKPRRRKP
jgi:hypothetical protein